MRITYKTLQPHIEQRLLDLLALPEGKYEPAYGWNHQYWHQDPASTEPEPSILAQLPAGSYGQREVGYGGDPFWIYFVPFGPFMHEGRYRDEEGLWINQTAPQLAEWLEEQGHTGGKPASKASIYKALDALVASGRWTKKKVGESVAVFTVYRPATVQ